MRRRVIASDPAAGYGLIRIEPFPAAQPARRLSEFDAASLLKPAKVVKVAKPARPGKARK